MSVNSKICLKAPHPARGASKYVFWEAKMALKQTYKFTGLNQILLKKCIGRRYGKFPDLLIFEIGKWNSPFWIALSNCKNIQKNFFEKVDYRGRYSSIFKMGTALGKRGVATSILKPHPCHPHHFGAETWWSHPTQWEFSLIFVQKLWKIIKMSDSLLGSIPSISWDKFFQILTLTRITRILLLDW